jgi:hypothetical protein
MAACILASGYRYRGLWQRVFWQVATDIAGYGSVYSGKWLQISRMLCYPPPPNSTIHFYPEDSGCVLLQIFISYHNAQFHNPQGHILDSDVFRTVEKKKYVRSRIPKSLCWRHTLYHIDLTRWSICKHISQTSLSNIGAGIAQSM